VDEGFQPVARYNSLAEAMRRIKTLTYIWEEFDGLKSILRVIFNSIEVRKPL
jgi:hypothetical protein